MQGKDFLHYSIKLENLNKLPLKDERINKNCSYGGCEVG